MGEQSCVVRDLKFKGSWKKEARLGVAVVVLGSKLRCRHAIT